MRKRIAAALFAVLLCACTQAEPEVPAESLPESAAEKATEAETASGQAMGVHTVLFLLFLGYP